MHFFRRDTESSETGISVALRRIRHSSLSQLSQLSQFALGTGPTESKESSDTNSHAKHRRSRSLTLPRILSRTSSVKKKDVDQTRRSGLPVPVPAELKIDPEEVYNGDEDDDDEEGEEDDSEPARLSLSESNKLGRKVSRQYASSIIGGVNVDSEAEEDEDSPAVSAEPDLSSRKVFGLSLPFTTPSFDRFNSISLLHSISTGSSKLPSLSLPRMPFNKESAEDVKERERIDLKLQRQESLNSVEERLFYKDITKLGQQKLTALKKAITPSLSRLAEDEWNESVFDRLDGDVVVLGGYRGSILRDKVTRRRTWIPVLKAGLNIRRINLLLGPKDEDELSAEDTIYPDGMLTHIGPVDISRKLIRRLAANPKVRVQDWGYDWRLSVDISAQRLHEKLKQIYAKNGHKPILLIGHSMGGIVAHGAMVLDKSLVRGIIYAGTPLPCINVMGPLRYNDNILLCKDMLTSEVNFMMRSSFIFVPEKDQCLFKDTANNVRYEIDFYDPKMWVKYNLSPIVSAARLQYEKGEPSDIKQQTQFAISFKEAYDYLCRTLERTRKFKQSIKYDPSQEYPPLALVYGNKVPSVKYSQVSGEEDIRKGVYYDFFYGPGDGVTHEKWLFPRASHYPLCGEFVSPNGHVGLLSDSVCVSKALEAILDEEKRRKLSKQSK